MMLLINISLIMVIAFFLLTLVIGLYYSSKTTTLREYAVGDKPFPTATLVATVLATIYSGGELMRNVEQVHHEGWWWVGFLLLANGGIWTTSRWALRMGPFMKHLSMAETMGCIYGRHVRLIAALSAIFCCIILVATQITIITRALHMCVNFFYPSLIAFLGTFFVVFYSIFGGIRAVAFTNLLQCITFVIILPLLAWFVFTKTNKSFLEIFPLLQSQEKLQWSRLFPFRANFWSMLALSLSCLLGYGVNPPLTQRIYMASDPIQARKVFAHATIFSYGITILIILIGLFAFVAMPTLAVTEVWRDMIQQFPLAFQGIVIIGLLAMAISTANTYLNACSTIISHDLIAVLRGVNKGPYTGQLLFAKLATGGAGLLAMFIAFSDPNLLDLFYLALDLYNPIVVAPFLLAVYGFRGTARTALIGMVTGVLTIYVWNRYVTADTGINGSFVAMLANGIAMMLAHHLLAQPTDVGWVPPDIYVKVVHQMGERSRERMRQSIGDFLSDRELVKHKPCNSKWVVVGLYTLCMTLLSYITGGVLHFWYILKWVVGMGCIWYAVIRKEEMDDWVITHNWLIALIISLPIDLFWHWFYMDSFAFNSFLFLSHLAICLVAFPIHMGLVVATLCLAFYSIYCMQVKFLFPPGGDLSLMITLFFALLALVGIAYYRLRLAFEKKRVAYFQEQERLRKEYELKQMAYNFNILPKKPRNEFEEGAHILRRVVDRAVRSLEIMENQPIRPGAFEELMGKFAQWAVELKEQARGEDYIVLQPSSIALNHLVGRLELELKCLLGRKLKVMFDKTERYGPLPSEIVCDVDQIIYILTVAVLGMIDPYKVEKQPISLQLYATHLDFHREITASCEEASAIRFPAIALWLHNSATNPDDTAQIDACYSDNNSIMEPTLSKEELSYSKDYDKKSIAPIVYAHYGHFAYKGYSKTKQNTVLMVLPQDVNEVGGVMLSYHPYLSPQEGTTLQEEEASLRALMAFHDYVCAIVDNLDSAMIADIVLFLRRHYGVQQHVSGVLFYVRAVVIAKHIAEWLPHSPTAVYAALLYDLVATGLPLSYIRAQYSWETYHMVEQLVKVGKREDLEEFLTRAKDQGNDPLKGKENFYRCVLYIKLAERIHDLYHARSYDSLPELQRMIEETLNKDIQLAHKYATLKILEPLEFSVRHASRVFTFRSCETETN